MPTQRGATSTVHGDRPVHGQSGWAAQVGARLFGLILVHPDVPHPLQVLLRVILGLFGPSRLLAERDLLTRLAADAGLPDIVHPALGT